jgi:hypothetical protein
MGKLDLKPRHSSPEKVEKIVLKKRELIKNKKTRSLLFVLNRLPSLNCLAIFKTT